MMTRQIHQIKSVRDFEEALHAARAIIFVFFEWSRQAARSQQFFTQWANRVDSPAAQGGCEIYQLSPDEHPQTWKWLAAAAGEAGEPGHGSVIWLRNGGIVGRVPNAAAAGAATLSRVTNDCFVLGKTGVSSGAAAIEGSFDAGLLNILCCPETHQELALAGLPALEKLNLQIAGGRMKNRGGQIVNSKVDAGLIRADGKYLYPLRHDIPILLVDEAIRLD
jgi:uncharacterized protein YbaR (Trm112 family)